MGWEALGQWGEDVVRGEPLTGGVGVNEVWSLRVSGRLAVGRLGQRGDADLTWETGLLRHLHRAGMPVPVPIPTTDGRYFAGGLVVMTYVEGGPPETEADWRRVAETLRLLHRLTHGWPQRPGWRSSADLLHAETATRVDLGVMPPEGVARCRAAWARLAGRPTCVVHGDPNPGNIRMTADRVAMIDWTSRTSTFPTSTWRCRTTPPVLATTRTTSPPRRRPHGPPPSAGTPPGPTSSPSSASPRSERSEVKSLSLVTISCAPDLMAAARTCRSSASRRCRPSISGSWPLTHGGHRLVQDPL